MQVQPTVVGRQGRCRLFATHKRETVNARSAWTTSGQTKRVQVSSQVVIFSRCMKDKAEIGAARWMGVEAESLTQCAWRLHVFKRTPTLPRS